MDNNQGKNTIIVLGTVHFDQGNAPEYIKALKNTIEEINPGIICVELSPDQLEGKVAINSKPEYPDAIIPTARQHGIEIVPIQPNTEEGLKLENEKEAAINRIRANEKNRVRWELWERLEELSQEKWLDALKDVKGIENVQSTQFDDLNFEPWYTLVQEYFPEFATLWNNWNQYFLERIEETITRHPGKLILATVGLAHKYWLWNKLKSRDDIILHNLQSFRQSRERSR
jgi:pheromone shutdown protein TraB